MKTILVPTQDIPAMESTLETAVLLAKRTGAYVEGVPLWFGVPEFVVAELASAFSIEVYRARRQEGTAGARKLFETFMQEHGVAARSTADGPTYGWFAEVPPGEGLVVDDFGGLKLVLGKIRFENLIDRISSAGRGNLEGRLMRHQVQRRRPCEINSFVPLHTLVDPGPHHPYLRGR